MGLNGLSQDGVSNAHDRFSSNGRLLPHFSDVTDGGQCNNVTNSNGVDNLTYKHSFVDIPLMEDEESEIQQTQADLNCESKSPVKVGRKTQPVSNINIKNMKHRALNKSKDDENKRLQEEIQEIRSNDDKHKCISGSGINLNEREQGRVLPANKQVYTKTRHISQENNHEKISRRVSNESKDSRQAQLKHLPLECLAVQKLLRRHSYELAISEYSWLPDNPPTYASCVEITNTYNHAYRQAEKKHSKSFENRAFDTEDHKENVGL